MHNLKPSDQARGMQLLDHCPHADSLPHLVSNSFLYREFYTNQTASMIRTHSRVLTKISFCTIEASRNENQLWSVRSECGEHTLQHLGSEVSSACLLLGWHSRCGRTGLGVRRRCATSTFAAEVPEWLDWAVDYVVPQVVLLAAAWVELVLRGHLSIIGLCVLRNRQALTS